MNYHNITHDDMLNGPGLRTVLWVAGCEHKCKHCHNPETHPVNSGIPFDTDAYNELFTELRKDYVAGVTFSGGDPLHPNNRGTITSLARQIHETLPNKTIWLYTGYNYEDIQDLEIMVYIDVLVDGKFVNKLKDNNLYWKGSSNQRVIDVQKTRQLGSIVIL